MVEGFQSDGATKVMTPSVGARSASGRDGLGTTNTFVVSPTERGFQVSPVKYSNVIGPAAALRLPSKRMSTRTVARGRPKALELPRWKVVPWTGEAPKGWNGAVASIRRPSVATASGARSCRPTSRLTRTVSRTGNELAPDPAIVSSGSARV